MSFFRGRPEEVQQVPTISPQQQQLLAQVIQALMGGGLAGGQNQALQYLQDILSDNPEAIQRMEAPTRRAFQEQTIPNILERFTSQGAGLGRSSAVGQQLSQAGQRLEEGLAAQREGLKGNAAQSLMSNYLSQLGLGLGTKGFENILRPGQPSGIQQLLASLGPGVGAFGSAVGGGVGTALVPKILQILGLT